MGPDETQLRADLDALPFRLGVRRGKWALVDVRFPLAHVRVAAPSRPGAGPPWFLLRVNAAGYPGQAPTAQLWDFRDDRPLAEALKPRARSGAVLEAFKTWSSGLYHPIDRLSREHWPGDQHRDLLWRADSDITHFLETVHALLDDPAYVGADAPVEAAFLPAPALDTPASRAA